MKSGLPLPVCLLALVGVLTFRVALIASLGDEDDGWWKKYHYKVYATKGEPISTDRTLKLLGKLAKGYQGRTDKGSMDRLSKVQKLLAVTVASEDNCNQEYFDELSKLMEYNSPFKLNMVPFLNEYGGIQFDLCKANFARDLKAAVGGLSDSAKSYAQALMGYIYSAQANEPEENSSRDQLFASLSEETNLVTGILAYLRSLSAQLGGINVLSPKVRASDFFAFMESKIVIPCSEIEQKLAFQLYVYDQDHADFLTRMDLQTEEWLLIGRVCRKINKQFDQLARQAHSTLQKQTAGSPALIKVARWFGSQVSKQPSVTARA